MTQLTARTVTVKSIFTGVLYCTNFVFINFSKLFVSDLINKCIALAVEYFDCCNEVGNFYQGLLYTLFF